MYKYRPHTLYFHLCFSDFMNFYVEYMDSDVQSIYATNRPLKCLLKDRFRWSAYQTLSQPSRSFSMKLCFAYVRSLKDPQHVEPRADDREEPYTWEPYIKPREPCERTHTKGWEKAEKAHTTQQVVASRMGTDEL